MKFDRDVPALDATDAAILELLQENCKQPLAAIGVKVGLSAPAVVERIHKLEEAGVIRGYAAILDAHRVGKDVAAFIGVATSESDAIRAVEAAVLGLEEVLECHHVTGAHTLLLKVRTENTGTLEQLIERVRSMEGVVRTETMVVLSTHTERTRIALSHDGRGESRPRRPGGRGRRAARASEA